MVNRTIQQKALKLKRRNRYAKFSGATSKFHVRIDRGRQDKHTGKHVEVLVGEVSLSNQVMSTGRGPDAERMQTYYNRLRTFDETIPQTLGLSEPMKELMKKYDEVIKDTPREMRISLVNNALGMLDLYFNRNQFFFVDIDYRSRKIRRSRIYGSKTYALQQLKNKRVVWVETIRSPRKAPTDPPSRTPL